MRAEAPAFCDTPVPPLGYNRSPIRSRTQRYCAHDALRPGGRLALFSNGYEEVSLRDELDAVYRQDARQIVAKTFVLGRHAPTLWSAYAARISLRYDQASWLVATECQPRSSEG